MVKHYYLLQLSTHSTYPAHFKHFSDILDLLSTIKTKQYFGVGNIVSIPELGNLGALPASRPDGTFVMLLLKLEPNLNRYHHLTCTGFPVEENPGMCA